MRFATLEEWLAWQETCHPTEIDLGLARVAEVAERLGILQAASAATVITVGGTNGKGTCVYTLERLLALDGAQFGSYNSPHLLRYNERIRINGNEAEDRPICRAFAAIDEARGQISLTYFEFATLAALWLFKELKLDYWILEVGLGGRLDATNIVDTDLAIITSIDLDHTEWLGATRDQIAAEKAGIFRSRKPVICLDENPPSVLLNAAQTLDCPLVELPVEVSETGVMRTLSVAGVRFDLQKVDLPRRSVAGAVLAMNSLGVLPRLDPRVVQQTLEQLKLLGRLQTREYRQKLVLMDVAHNPAAVNYLVQALVERFPEHVDRGFHVVIGMMGDKDIQRCLLLLDPLVAVWRFCGIPGVSRAAPPQTLCDLSPRGLSVKSVYPSVAEGLDVEFNNSAGDHPLLVLGSFYTVSEALKWLDASGGGG